MALCPNFKKGAGRDSIHEESVGQILGELTASSVGTIVADAQSSLSCLSLAKILSSCQGENELALEFYPLELAVRSKYLRL